MYDGFYRIRSAAQQLPQLQVVIKIFKKFHTGTGGTGVLGEKVFGLDPYLIHQS